MGFQFRFRVWGIGFLNSGLGVSGMGFGGFGFAVSGFRFLDFRVSGIGFPV